MFLQCSVTLAVALELYALAHPEIAHLQWANKAPPRCVNSRGGPIASDAPLAVLKKRETAPILVHKA